MRSEKDLLFKKLNERFVKAFATYKLLADGDHVLVGLSGGKDSLLLTELLAKRAHIQHPSFSVEAVHVRMKNISYETSMDYLQQFCNDLGVKLHIVATEFETRDAEDEARSAEDGEIRNFKPQSSNPKGKEKPVCFLCSWHRRKQLFNLAQELGCNKIALGHHRDDIIHTTLMNLMFQGRFGTMPALLKMRKMPLSIIRPLCLIDEADVRRYAELAQYQKLVKLCPYEHDTFRTEVAQLFNDIERMNPEARFSIWKALQQEGKLTEEY